MLLIYGVLSDFNVTCTGKSITGSGASEYCATGYTHSAAANLLLPYQFK